MLDRFINYYKAAHKQQLRSFEGHNYTDEEIGCELIVNVPIYDVVKRRYAAFSSLPEAIWYLDKDPKGNGNFFINTKNNISDVDFLKLCYLLRLCGSGINYKPKDKSLSLFETSILGTHGFGNFWIVNELLNNNYTFDIWLKNIPEKNFCDVKGYMLPLIKGGIRKFIVEESNDFIEHIINFISKGNKKEIKETVDFANKYLINKGYNRQNFVLSAFVMDIAEYFKGYVCEKSDVYLGSNASKCINLILPKVKKDFAIRHLCEITGNISNPMDMEDVACDFIRYINNFQSTEHVKNNKGKIYECTF